MTFNLSYGGGLTADDLQAQFAKQKKLECSTAWYNPVEDAIYASDNDRTPNYPEGNCVVPHVANVRKALELDKDASSTEIDKATYGIYNDKNGWDDLANEYFHAIKTRTAGVMVPADYAAVEVTNVLSTLLGLPERNFVLQNAALTIPTPYIDTRVDTWSGFDVAEDIKLGAEIPPGQGTLSSTTYSLKLNGAHIAKYDELDMKPRYWDVWRTNLENIARRMVKKKAQLIGTELETGTGVGGADWGAVTANGFSTNNPLDQIGGVADTIVSNDGNPDSVALHDRSYRDLITNSNVHGMFSPAGLNQAGQAKTATVPGINYTFYVDNLMTNTVAVVYDKQAIVAFQGPTGTSTYRDNLHRFEGYIVTDYFLTKITQSGKIRKLTTVSA